MDPLVSPSRKEMELMDALLATVAAACESRKVIAPETDIDHTYNHAVDDCMAVVRMFLSTDTGA
jgi:hypothetical protein